MKLWGGRFEKDTSGLMDDFHSSISFDCELCLCDIRGSIAHARMLGEQGIISVQDADSIIDGLEGILADYEKGLIAFSPEAEDIHMNIETLLIQRIGDAGKRLHTGRSRNDQVALDIRLYMLDELTDVKTLLSGLCGVTLRIADANLNTVMAGYTHLQKAQPVTLAHYMMAYCNMFLRDIDRVNDCRRRTDMCPLGSGALAGTTYPLSRRRTAELLGFSGVCANSLDGVSDRDFLIEAASCFSLIMVHLSRFCEELVLWSSNEFGYVEMDDAFSTGSSIMPQKKNPDVCELVRGKSGRVFGDLTALLTVMKGIPLAYNKDMQEDKEAIFDAVKTVKKCLGIFTCTLDTCTFRVDRMRAGAVLGFTNATDAADYLVRQGIPFRDAHAIIGKMVLYCSEKGCGISDLSLDELKGFSSVINEDFFNAVSVDTCVSQRKTEGGPAPEAVLASIARARSELSALTRS